MAGAARLNLLVWVIGLAGFVLISAVISRGLGLWAPPEPPIRIGVLHSLSGTMATSEAPLVDAIQLAVEEINSSGGLNGRRVEMVVRDGRSDWDVFAREAEVLIGDERVSALFACWTSACRKAVKPVVERYGHLMFYPVQYEGLEQSPHLIYTGAAPNQQVIPGALWAIKQLGPRLFLIGSDYVFPRTANLLIREVVSAGDAEIVAECYRPLGDVDFSRVIDRLRATAPDAILNTVNGDSNLALFRALEDSGLAHIPVVSFSVGEVELSEYALADVHHPHHYTVWNYFQSLESEENRAFVQAFRARFGAARVVSDPMVSAYVAVQLWAQAVREVHSDAVNVVNPAVPRQSVPAPFGVAAVNAQTRHLWKPVLIGKALPDGQFELVLSGGPAVRPRPYPDYRSRGDWDAVAAGLLGGVPGDECLGE